jgi:hypothetical protein
MANYGVATRDLRAPDDANFASRCFAEQGLFAARLTARARNCQKMSASLLVRSSEESISDPEASR